MKLQVKYSIKGLFLPLQYTHTHVQWPINSVALVLMQISDFSSKSSSGWEAESLLAVLYFKLNCPLYLSVIASNTFSASSVSV